MRSFLLLLPVLGFVADPSPASESFHEAETKALAVREAIHSGELRLHLESDRARDSNFYIFFDGQNVRFDRIRQVTGFQLPASANNPVDIKKRPSPLDYLTKTVLTPEKYIFFSPTKLADGNPLALKTGPRAAEEHYELDTFDIRVLGIVPLPYAILYMHHAKDILANADRINSWSSKDTINGVRCIKCSHTTDRGNIVSVWIVPDQGYSIPRSQIEYTNESGVHRVYRAESVLKHHAEADLWFPSEVTFQSLRDGEVIEREKWVVEEATFNQPIPPETFELAGLGIPDGHPMAGVPQAEAVGFAVWDGEKKLPVQPSAERIRQALPEAPPGVLAPLQGKEGTWTRAIIVVNVVALGIVLFAFLWFRFKRKKAS